VKTLKTHLVIRLAAGREVHVEIAAGDPVEVVEVKERGPRDPEWSPPLACVNDEAKAGSGRKYFRTWGEYVYQVEPNGDDGARRSSGRHFARNQ
jgi:hypothetical protein